MNDARHTIAPAFALAAIALTVAVASGCGGNGSSSASSTPTDTTTTPTTTNSSGAGTQVLPVAKNPIANTSTAAGLTITKVLVENNVAADTGKAIDDHLEIALENTSTKPLDQIAIYYAITDKAKGTTEGYYTKLDGLTIEPGTTRIVHFDNTGKTDHYPVNKYSLYYTDKNKLRIDVTASSPTVKVATFTVNKDAGGAEAGVE
jgi:low affinity Fe/Cu permease